MQWNVLVRGVVGLAVGFLNLPGLTWAADDTPPNADQEAALFTRQLASWLSEKQVASASVAVIRDGELAWLAAAGHASEDRPARTDTLYNVASLAKPLTAELSLRLLSQRHWQLDEPLATWWVDPDLGDDARVAKLSARIILSHQTGFPNWRDARLKFEFEPGSRFGYSGEGFEYLARAMSVRTGRDFESLMTKTVLEPLGMRHTVQTKKRWMQHLFAVPYDEHGKPVPPQFAVKASAADDLYTTAEDYARLLVAILAEAGVSKSLSEQRRQIQVDRLPELCGNRLPAQCPDRVGFGLGWEVFEIHGVHYLMHTGRDTGTFALAYLSPERQSGIVILTNSDHGASVVLPILDSLGLDPDFNDWLRTLAGES